jgi:hypothetical protein
MARFRREQLSSSTMLRVFLIVLILQIATCAIAPAQTPPPLNLGGTWKGESRVIPCLPRQSALGRCNAVNRITFTLEQDGSVIRGKYKCAIGTAVCRDANKTTKGKIVDGTLSGQTIALRVMFSADVSSCLFNGNAGPAAISGTYRCYAGGGLSEMGTWQVSRPGSTEQAPDRR